jgi:hypothetical protein
VQEVDPIHDLHSSLKTEIIVVRPCSAVWQHFVLCQLATA